MAVARVGSDALSVGRVIKVSSADFTMGVEDHNN